MVNRLRKAFPMKNRAYLKEKAEVEDKHSEEAEEELNLEKAIMGVKRKRKQYEVHLPQINLDRCVKYLVVNMT
jgi:hypothetical protein